MEITLRILCLLVGYLLGSFPHGRVYRPPPNGPQRP